MKNKTVICFEGTNNQIWKIESRLTKEQMRLFKIYCDRAKEYTGTNFYGILLQGKSEEELLNSYNEMMLTYISNCVVSDYLISVGVIPDALIGYSLGVNSALVCSGALSFEGGIDIIKLLYKSMRYSAEYNNYAMALIVGVYEDFIYRAIKELGYDRSILDIASHNSEYSFLVVGDGDAIEHLGKYCIENGAMLYNKIESYIPFHFNLTESWLTDNVDQFRRLQVTDIMYKVFSTYSFTFLADKDQVIDELIRNVYTKIRWNDAIIALEDQGFRNFIDVSITSSNKKITCLSKNDSCFYTLKNYDKLLNE